MPSDASRRDMRLWLGFIAASALLSAVYGRATDDAFAGTAQGALVGGLVSAILAGLEIFGARGAWAAPLRRLPFLPFFLLRTAIYLATILFGIAAGSWLISLLLRGSGEIEVPRDTVFFALAISLVMNLVFAINRLLGQGVLWNFVAGRYRRPRVEERVLLFIDIEGSTRIAEQLGEVRYLDFLNRFYADIVGAVLLERGEIHKYVGDELIATWPLAAGLREARCVRACFGALAALGARAAAYEREFALRANFRAALHCGPVVRGELGTIKMEIALLGDTVNTAARIQQACRELGHRVLASGDLMARLATLPHGIAARALGPVVLRGKESPIELYALSAAEPPLTSGRQAASG
jgi:adenylate cyclase